MSTVFRLCLLSATTLSLTAAEIITASINEYHNGAIVCNPEKDCEIQCEQANACTNAHIYCPVNHDCDVTCDSVDACSNVVINATQSSLFILNSCKNNACSNLTIYFPSTIRGVVSGVLRVGNQLNSHSNRLHFYAIHGWIDIDTSYSEHSFEHGNNGIMHCSPSYSHQCEFAQDAWSCADDKDVCNDYVVSSKDGTTSLYDASAASTTSSTTSATIEQELPSFVSMVSGLNQLWYIIGGIILCLCCVLCVLMYLIRRAYKLHSETADQLKSAVDELKEFKAMHEVFVGSRTDSYTQQQSKNRASFPSANPNPNPNYMHTMNPVNHHHESFHNINNNNNNSHLAPLNNTAYANQLSIAQPSSDKTSWISKQSSIQQSASYNKHDRDDNMELRREDEPMDMYREEESNLMHPSMLNMRASMNNRPSSNRDVNTFPAQIPIAQHAPDPHALFMQQELIMDTKDNSKAYTKYRKHNNRDPILITPTNIPSDAANNAAATSPATQSNQAAERKRSKSSKKKAKKDKKGADFLELEEVSPAPQQQDKSNYTFPLQVANNWNPRTPVNSLGSPNSAHPDNHDESMHLKQPVSMNDASRGRVEKARETKPRNKSSTAPKKLSNAVPRISKRIDIINNHPHRKELGHGSLDPKQMQNFFSNTRSTSPSIQSNNTLNTQITTNTMKTANTMNTMNTFVVNSSVQEENQDEFIEQEQAPSVIMAHLAGNRPNNSQSYEDSPVFPNKRAPPFSQGLSGTLYNEGSKSTIPISVNSPDQKMPQSPSNHSSDILSMLTDDELHKNEMQQLPRAPFGQYENMQTPNNSKQVKTATDSTPSRKSNKNKKQQLPDMTAADSSLPLNLLETHLNLHENNGKLRKPETPQNPRMVVDIFDGMIGRRPSKNRNSESIRSHGIASEVSSNPFAETVKSVASNASSSSSSSSFSSSTSSSDSRSRSNTGDSQSHGHPFETELKREHVQDAETENRRNMEERAHALLHVVMSNHTHNAEEAKAAADEMMLTGLPSNTSQMSESTKKIHSAMKQLEYKSKAKPLNRIQSGLDDVTALNIQQDLAGNGHGDDEDEEDEDDIDDEEIVKELQQNAAAAAAALNGQQSPHLQHTITSPLNGDHTFVSDSF